MPQVYKKFIKAFITGGLSAVSASLLLGVKIASLDDLKGFSVVLAVAFFSGAVHAILELLNPTLPATTVTTTTTAQTTPTPIMTTTATTNVPPPKLQ